MALAQPVLNLLSSLELTGLPTRIQPGMPVRPRLSPSLDVLTAAVEEVLAVLDLPLTPLKMALNLDKINLFPAKIENGVPVPDPDAGKADLKVALKGVEFETFENLASNIDPDLPARNKLPYIVPHLPVSLPLLTEPGAQVEGLLGRAQGTIQGLQRVAGSLLGTITAPPDPVTKLESVLRGTLRRAVPGLDLKITVQWKIQDASGRDLTADKDFILLDNTRLTGEKKKNESVSIPPPVFALLPEFADPAVGGDMTARRYISCVITVDAETGKPEDKIVQTVGPIGIDLPRIPVPTVLALTEHAQTDARFPGAVFMAVPKASPVQLGTVDQTLKDVKSLLDPVLSLLKLLNHALLQRFEATSSVIEELLNLLRTNNLTFVRTDRIDELGAFTLEPGGILGIGGRSWEDEASAVLLIGPPGRTASLHDRRNLWVGAGAFEVTAGPSLVAFVKTLKQKHPACFPSNEQVNVFREPQDGHFNDNLSSFRFVPQLAAEPPGL
jgi:hypothetical protein